MESLSALVPWQVHLEGGVGAGSQGEGPPGRQGHQGDHLRGRRRQRNDNLSRPG